MPTIHQPFIKPFKSTWDFSHGISHQFAAIHRDPQRAFRGAGEPPDLGGALHAAGAAGTSRPLRCRGDVAPEIHQEKKVV